MYLFEGLKQVISSYLPPEQVELIRQAYIVGRDAHEGQMRSSGDPYITHPIAVANILASIHLDHETLMAALLHDVIEDTAVTKEDLSEQFGVTVADLVEGVSKLDKIKFSNKEEAQAENFRKMMMAMVQDIRVILIKLADRTHNMRTLGSLRPDKRRRIARETLEIYAPIANRLGIHNAKNELEELGFEAMYPMRAKALRNAVKAARGNRKEIINSIKHEIQTRLDETNIQAKVYGREKHLYSIYRKMVSKELSFNEVMDIYAFRVNVDSIDTCYRVLGAVHNLYKPIETRFKDYIAIPKSNGYQSLHTSLVGPHGIPVEIQIRTEEMDQMANNGVAAHWLYKKNDSLGNTAQVRARRWMQSLLELQQSAGNSFEFIDSVKTDLFPDEIYVFSPDGRIIELPMGATAVDFAYAVHTDIGNACVGARVDRKPFPLSAPLDTGQSIEIITSSGARPNASWLNFAATAKARAKIRYYLKHQQKEESIILGKRLLSHALNDISIENIDPEIVSKVLAESKCKNLNDLYGEIGIGNLMSIAIARRLSNQFDDQTSSAEVTSINKAKMPVKGAEGMLVNFSKCCRPIPGDQIVAHISPGKGLTIHRVSCRNIKGHDKDPGHYFPVQWDAEHEKEFTSEIRVEIINHQGVLAKLTNVIASTESNIQNLHTDEKSANLYTIDVQLTVKNRVHLANVMKRIRVMPDVQRVIRYRK